MSHAGVCDTAATAIPVPVPPAAGHVNQATTAAVEQGNALLDAVAAQLLLLVAEGAKDGVILVAGDVEVMKALPA